MENESAIEIINLTGHDVNILSEDGTMTVFPSLGRKALVREFRHPHGTLRVQGQYVQLNKVQYGNVVGLPPEEDGVMYIVPWPVARELPERHDLLISDERVRINGRITAARALGVLERG